MTGLQWFAAVGMPFIIVVLAFAAVRLNEWDLGRKRHDRVHPGE